MKRSKQVLRALADAVKGGALTKQKARTTVVLLKMSGHLDEPDVGTDPNQLRSGERKMKRLKSNTPAAVGANTKAGKIFAGARVKDAADRLSEKKYAVKGRDGNVLKWGSKTVETQSEREKAQVGVWFKRMMQKQGVPGIVLSDWERALLTDHVEKGQWVGDVGGAYYGGGADRSDFAPNSMVKALLDDTVSGGLFLTPYEFDSNIVTVPLLHSEVFGLCDVVPVSARRIDTARMGNLTMTWSQNPGTALTPFNTANLVSEIPTPTYPVAGAIELDNNMLVDSPVNIGAKVTELYSERLKAELDRVIVSGNGYNEPLGVTNTSGLVTVNSDNGTGGPPTVSDYESLIFSVPKQYRAKDWNPSFVANDTSYRRARAIPVGPGDERRVFGMDTQAYTLLDYPYKVQNDIANNRLIFGCWKRYRAYQRLGSEVVVTRDGRQLTLTNTTLVVIRARFGGQPIDPNAFALMTDAQS